MLSPLTWANQGDDRSKRAEATVATNDRGLVSMASASGEPSAVRLEKWGNCGSSGESTPT
jgi:hypothetical protein